MKGVARSDGHSSDYEAVVVAFSRLSHAVISDESPAAALLTAAEIAALLLQTDKAAVFTCPAGAESVEVAAAYQLAEWQAGEGVPGEPVIRECLTKCAAVVIPSLQADDRSGLQGLIKCGAASVLCVPLLASETVLGAVMVLSNTLRSFSAGDIELLSAVADQASLAAWRLRELNTKETALPKGADSLDKDVMELAHRKIRELSIVNKVSEAVISTLDLGKLLELALEQCLYAVGATVGSIMLVDDNNRLSIMAARGIPQEIVETVSVPVGEGIAGWVAEHGQPVLVQDARRDPRFKMNRYRDDISSAMSVPLKARGRVIGVLNASTVEKDRRYGPREIEFLTTVANQAAMAIDNARVYARLDQRSKELSGLLQISEAITSTLELREVLSLLSERFRAMAQVDASALLVFDLDADRFRCLDGQGLSAKIKRGSYLELAMPIAQEVREKLSPVCGETTPGAPYASEVSAAVELKSAAAVPLIASGRFVGVVALFSHDRRTFLLGELDTLAALGKLAGVAVHNALIYQHKYEIARSLQFQLVPNVPLKAEGLEIGHKYAPAREVGGDYYDLMKVVPGKVGVVIADVAGNSVPAAMYTSMGKNVLKAYAIGNESPGDVLRRLNVVACDETQAEVFISLFYGIFESAAHTFRFACAGHEPPVLFTPDGTMQRLHADGLLVGISSSVEYEEKEIPFAPGSIMVMFTDGLVDAPAVRGKFGVPEIQEIVLADPLKPAQELADNIYARLMEIAGSRVQDDVALVVLKAL